MEFLMLLLCSFLPMINLVHAQSAQGFVSLACGMTPEDFTLLDKQTQLTYTSDARFINTGESGRIRKEYESSVVRQAWYVRSFPVGTRNCYSLNATEGSKYLVRAYFVYGNYDGKNMNPIFDLYIGPNKVFTVGAQSDSISLEFIHVPTSNSLQICLVRLGTTVPFISTLELRPVNNHMIYNVENRNESLVLSYRSFVDNGVTEYIRFRFPDDIHDRFWRPTFTFDWNHLTTAREVNTSSMYEPPKPAMQMAAVPENSTSPFTLQVPSNGLASRLRFYLHFAEIEELKPNETREFDIMLNGIHYYGPVRPKPFYAETVEVMTSTEGCNQGSCLLQLVRTSASTHPPILNAIELYFVLKFLQPETDRTDVETMIRIKEEYGLNITSWEGDPCSPTELTWDGLNCTSDDPLSISSLNLSSCGLTGIISPWIQNLTHLISLDLSNNNLTGRVPEFLATMRSLSVINLRNNILNGPVPDSLLNRANNGSLQLYLEENPNLHCPSDACKNQDTHQNKAKSNHAFVLPTILGSIASFFAIISAFSVFLLLRERSRRGKGTNKNSPGVGRRFSYSDIIRMTNHFDKVLGRGGFGIVYHGYLNEHEQVAVKILSEPSTRGLKQFRAEVELLLRVHHKNLVHLIGYCDEMDNSALIYEYMSRGDLKNQLSGNTCSELLSLKNRVRIVAEAGQGLEYLHNGCKPPMVHRDIKTSNILLDENLLAKVADFGLSKSFDHESNSHTSTAVVGTHGYLDPEYRQTGWLTEKSDVYSFGVVVLEILTSQPVIEDTREGNHITEWVQNMLVKGDVREIVDPRLGRDISAASVWRVIEMAMACVNPSPRQRPNMGQVVAQLKECLASEHNNGSIDVSLVLSDEFTPIAR
ncbi:PREDICTED: probable LRR receptor-like serine/threonine-protein kinase At1g51820 isoform X2 [Tarenaya hassleriana]|uniref:probable LRR receptor-like serine/threonine-protein kinase At1g51820 isoform X2 n=1 Tax=Tarenaya hassleriana TaxID=28532 RepID=UPI00053C5A39|nr:PREDICTED: probable LRR receptor-like serine/threonine-protein kinase At1g51820 isoform X2 [Tarenaya hassleriana]